MILEFITTFHTQDIVNILSEKDILGFYSIKIDFLRLFEIYPDIGDKILCSPISSLSACNKDIIKAQQDILKKDQDKSLINKLPFTYLKRNVHARFFGLPFCSELHRTIFPKNTDLGCFLSITGTVVRITQAKMLEYQRKYICMKCKYENTLEADFENRYILKAPSKCGNTISKCKSSTFSQVNLVSREHCKDYQEIKIQEQVNKLSIGTIPGSMWVVLEDDLVDTCKPGDDIIICATVRRRWRPTALNKKSEVDLVLQANYIEVVNVLKSDAIAMRPDIKKCLDEFWRKYEPCPLKGRDRILASVCHQVYGLYLVKLAVLLTVITGSNHVIDSDQDESMSEDKHSISIRGQCHLLLVGDPGTGKSQLLKSSAELSLRSVFTSGAGSTKAGLTCAAIKEDGEWQLEAGALVLSDSGVCCIDEISQLRDHDRTAIHEAMEQQTVSVAKAGIVCKLRTRCAVIAACNPKGHYQKDQPLSVNVSLGTPLLSRFDLIFILLDSKNKAWDKLVSTHILFGDSDEMESSKNWTTDNLQMYIGLIGTRDTDMTKSANTIIQSYYMMQRNSEYRDPSRTTVRMLDSLIRLSQAHCRLMYRTTILPMDAIMAISLVDLSMQDFTLEDTVDALHSNFEKYPDFHYLCTAKNLLGRLNLHDIWNEELLYYGKLLQVDHKTLNHDIENGNFQAFAKYDDISDDDITLSSSLVTSSYFNNKRNHGSKISKNKLSVEGINEKLAATLKKHASLNKIERVPPVTIKKAVKRRKKEVTVAIDSSEFFNKKSTKKVKKVKIENSDSNECDVNEMLNGVPSVNDIFKELDIDFKLCNSSDSNSSEMFDNKSSLKKKLPEENIEKESKNSVKRNSKNKDQSNSSNKLKLFKYEAKHDLNKFYEAKQENLSDNMENTRSETELDRVKSLDTKEKSSRNLTIKTQISMFETDCDIDLDI